MLFCTVFHLLRASLLVRLRTQFSLKLVSKSTILYSLLIEYHIVIIIYTFTATVARFDDVMERKISQTTNRLVPPATPL